MYADTQIGFSSLAMQLVKAGYKIEESGAWMFHGTQIMEDHWCFHVSCAARDLNKIVESFIAGLIPDDVCFRMIRDIEYCYKLHGGGLDASDAGKVATFFCTDEKVLQQLFDCINSIAIDEGPVVFFALRVSPTIYIERVRVKQQSDNSVMVTAERPRYKTVPIKGITIYQQSTTISVLVRRGYLPIRQLHCKPSGAIFLAKNLHQLPIRSCVVKQGVKGMMEERNGRSIIDRLRWQGEVIRELQNEIPTAKIIDQFVSEGNEYLVLEYINGVKLPVAINNLKGAQTWPDVRYEVKKQVLNWYLSALSIVEKIHEKGYVHRDLQDNNFLVCKGEVFLIDFELAWDKKRKFPNPAFTLGTIGYISPQQLNHERPDTPDDVYSMGALLFYLITFLHPRNMDSRTLQELEAFLSFFSLPQEVVSVLISCLEARTDQRPPLQRIRDVVERYIRDIEPINVVNYFN